MIRIKRYHAEMALDLLDAAKDAGDEMVIAACRRVRSAYLLGRRAYAADLELINTFSE